MNANQITEHGKPPRARPNWKVPGIVAAVLILAGAILLAGVYWLKGSKPLDDEEHVHDTAVELYTCGMHKWIILPKPGECPICHMELTPIDPAKFTGEVAIDPLVVQNIGVRVDPVISGPLVRTIRTVGNVEFDETRVRDVNIKINGWIEKLYVDYLGAQVARDEPLFDLYSPELFAAQEQYLLAWRNRAQRDTEAVSNALEGNFDLLEASRTRLEYFDITDEQITELEQRDTPAKTMTIRSPYQGVVIAKHANEGMKVDPGMQVFRIADLSKVWVMVSLYENQLPYVSVGQQAVMSLSYIPGQTFEGRVIYIYPYLEIKERQIKVRLEFDNPAPENSAPGTPGLLKPGMYANVQLKSTLRKESTLAPRSAIIDTGTRKVAFVSLGKGRFEPRDVQIGVETDDGFVQVIDGLKVGEMVVTNGQFLLDSEARMREALAKMVRGTPAIGPSAVAPVAGASELQALPEPMANQLAVALDAYFAMGDSLANDSLADIAAPARQLAGAIDELLKVPVPADEHFWHRHEEAATVRGNSLQLLDATDLETARLLFADLSIAFSKLAKATGIPPTYVNTVQELYCPMYREGQGGTSWLQIEGVVRNPYFGAEIPRCFDRRTTLPTTGAQEN